MRFASRELLRHSDVRFNDNGTMTYVATRTAVFLPEMTNISLDAKLILPNFAALVSNENNCIQPSLLTVKNNYILVLP